MNDRKSAALTIGRSDYRETSQIVTFYSREFGKLRTLAKGSKRPKNKFDGPFDLLTYGEIVFIYKPVNRLQILTECKVRDNFAGLRRDYKRIQSAMYLAEFLDQMTEVEDKYPDLFDLSIETLQELAEGSVATNLLMISFSARALKYLGYMPVISHCIRCESPEVTSPIGSRSAVGKGEVTFSLKRGGVVCPECQDIEPAGRITTLGVLSLLRQLCQGRIALDKFRISGPMLAELAGFLRDYINQINGRGLRCLAIG